MGYTHYISNKSAFTDEQWERFTKDAKALLASSKIPLAGPEGVSGTAPLFGKNDIMFNGVEGDSHETASVSKSAVEFDFCKTAFKPYDSVVVDFYKLVRKYLPSTRLSSDGGESVFGS
jgi:hypothetical protein